MALDKNGIPIPVFVPPSPPPPGATPPNQVAPSIENDVALLKGEVSRMVARFSRVETLGADVAQLGLRTTALEALRSDFGLLAAKFAVVEEAFGGLPKILERIADLETLAGKLEQINAMTYSRLEALEKQLFAAQEKGIVEPIKPS